jgi:hypothetical protein
MDQLPDELLRMVFAQLCEESRLRCRAVCLRWHSLLRGAHMWPRATRQRHTCSTNGLYSACLHGDAGAAARLIEYFEPAAQDVRSLFGSILWHVCDMGHLEVAQLLVAAFDLAAVARTRGCAYESLRHACAHSRLDIASWLTATFGLTAEHVRNGRCRNGHSSRGDDFLRSACEEGRLGVAKWLTATFGFTANDVCVNDGELFLLVCNGGHLDVAQWLIATFGHMTSLGDALIAAVEGGHVAVGTWLMGMLGLGVGDIRAGQVHAACVRALRTACVKGHVEMVQWLVEVVGLGRDEIRGSGAVDLARNKGHDALANWLSDRVEVYIA